MDQIKIKGPKLVEVLHLASKYNQRLSNRQSVLSYEPPFLVSLCNGA